MRRIEHKTKRLIIRPMRSSDYLAWFDAHVNSLPAKNKWDSGPESPKKYTREWFKKLLKWEKDMAKKDEYYTFGVFEKKTGHLVGLVDFDIYARRYHQFSNFGYRIYNRYWRMGYGQEAAAEGLRIGFQDLKLNRLEAAIHLDHKKSIRLAKAIGMRREGIKKRYWYEHGKWVDHLIYVANPEDIGLKATAPK